MTNILEKIDNYLNEATKPTFEEFCDKNIKNIKKFWQRKRDDYLDEYEDEDGRVSDEEERNAEESASGLTIKKFKNKFAYNKKEHNDYMDFVFAKFGG